MRIYLIRVYSCQVWVSLSNVLFNLFVHSLGDSTNAFINENWRDILQEINPLVEDTIGEVMMQIIKNLLDLYSLEDLLPE